ncbi:MAG TPA: Uma2 family endonuclease [Planctomycetaceae bacterium]|nr:Uma2 family endonuclease [Planctomycetaceae bacterium]
MTSITTPAADVLLTAEEYLHCAPSDYPSELVRGKIVTMNPPFSAHGYWCSEIAGTLRDFVRANRLGRVLTNDGGVITTRGPDTVRGADVAFYSYERVPPGPPPEGYWPAPDLVVEVRSSDDRWIAIQRKVTEYLESNVRVVVVIDPAPQCMHVFTSDFPSEVLSGDHVLTFPQILPGFSLRITDFFNQ